MSVLRPPLVALALPLLFSLLHATSIPFTARPTAPSDIIGIYTLHPETDIAARANSCPQNLTTDTFEFQVTRAPPSLLAPSLFNIQIDHRNTEVSGLRCESSGTIVATTSRHPFARDNATEVLRTWAAAGRRRAARWISDDFIQAAETQSWAVGYDFVERSCRGIRIRPGVAFLWIQPNVDLVLGDLPISGRNKYLIVTYANDPWSGCVYVADTVGGEGEFAMGPVSDPSLTAVTEPDTIDTSAPSPTGDDEEESPEPSTDGEEEDDDDSADDEPPEPTDTTPLEPPPGVNEVFTSNSEEDDTESDPACFPSSAVIELSNGNRVPLHSLQLGHNVRVANGKFSDVFFFSHRVNTQNSLHHFVRLSTESGEQLTLSPDHYLYCDDQLMPARQVAVGGKLIGGDGKQRVVSRVQNVQESGLIAPHTLHGDIVVDGILVSTYTATVHPYLAHYVLLAPVRALYHLGYPHFLGGLLDSGADTLRRIMPSGPQRLARFL